MKKISIIASSLLLGAASLNAQTGVTVSVSTGSGASAPGTALVNLLSLAQQLVNQAAPLLVGVAIICLFGGLIYFLWKGRSDEGARKSSLTFMAMSVLAIFVMVSIWGLIGFLGSAVGVGQGGKVPVPQIPNSVGTY